MPEVTLRDVVADDILVFHRHQSDPVSVEMAQVPPRDEPAYVAHWQGLLDDAAVGKKTILSGGLVVGQVISFTREGVRELGYWIDRSFWGRGIASAAVRQYLSIERHRPLFAVVAERNVASLRILEHAGFARVGRKGGALRLQLEDVAPALSAGQPRWSQVVELRQYTLHPGQRDVLIDLFDAEFIEPQERVGMKVIGQFRDLDDPDRFVWLRGFTDMEARARGLGAFYHGPVWKAHRDTANATMIDSSNVLLLRPATPTSAFGLRTHDRAAAASAAGTETTVVAGIHRLDRRLETALVDVVAGNIKSMVASAGGVPLAVLVTEPSENTFPALPVRENEEVLVWLAAFADPDALASDPGRVTRLLAACGVTTHSSTTLRLAPTSRSLVPGASVPMAEAARSPA